MRSHHIRRCARAGGTGALLALAPAFAPALAPTLAPAVATAFATAFAPAVALAQDGVVRGVVVDSTGAAIRDADVSIVALRRLTRSDSLGRFDLPRIANGSYELSVRRLGYAPQRLTVVVSDAISYAYRVVLDVQPTTIDGVHVSAAEERLRLGIEDFYRRRARGGGGKFFTRDDIAARHAKVTSDVLRTAPGIRLVHTRDGQGVRFVGSSSSRRACPPELWLDGQLVRGMEVDQVVVSDIEGIEVYNGPSTTPLQFSHAPSRDACGVIVIWTRIPGGG